MKKTVRLVDLYVLFKTRPLSKMKARGILYYVVLVASVCSNRDLTCQVLMKSSVTTSEILKFDSLMANLSEYSSRRNRAYFDAILVSTKTNGWRQKRNFNKIVSLAQTMKLDSAERLLRRIPTNDIYYTRAESVLTGYGRKTTHDRNLEGNIGQYILTTQILDGLYTGVMGSINEKIPHNILFIAYLKTAIDELEKGNNIKSVTYFEKAKNLAISSWQKMYYQKAQALASVIQSPDKSIPTWYKIGLDTILIDGDIQYHSATDNELRKKMISIYANNYIKREYLSELFRKNRVTAKDSALIRQITDASFDFGLLRQASGYGDSTNSSVNARILEAEIKIKRYSSILTYGYVIAAISVIGLILSYGLLRKRRKKIISELESLVHESGKANEKLTVIYESELKKLSKISSDYLIPRTPKEG